MLGSSCLGAHFIDQQDDFISECLGDGNSAQLQRTHPSCHLLGLHGVEHIAEFLHFSIGISIFGSAFETIQLLVIIILDAFADGSQQTLLFASFVLTAATVFVRLANGRHRIDFAFFDLTTIVQNANHAD